MIKWEASSCSVVLQGLDVLCFALSSPCPFCQPSLPVSPSWCNVVKQTIGFLTFIGPSILNVKEPLILDVKKAAVCA
eukprot:1161990-Pelagomonas_calceolata.AAC.8